MLLDIGVGILSSIFLSRFFGIGPNPTFLAAGILFSFLPDIDYFFASLFISNQTGSRAHEHRTILHYPLLFIPTGSIILFATLNYRFAMLFALASLLHFLHDSIGIGWGIPWLYPFSRNNYVFFYQYDLAQHAIPQKLFYSLSPAEVDHLSSQYGDEHWMKHIYLQLHPYAIVELMVFILAIAALLYTK